MNFYFSSAGRSTLENQTRAQLSVPREVPRLALRPRMATPSNPEHSSRLARFVGWALVKNRQLRRDAQALRSALFSFPFAEKRRAGTSAGAAETTASAPRRRVSPTATPASTSARPLRVPTARPRAGEARDGDPDGARRASDEEPRETREQKEALFDCETYLRAIGVPAGLPPLRVSYRVPSAFFAGTSGAWRPEQIESLPTLHDEDRRKAYKGTTGIAFPRRRRRDTVVDEPSNASNDTRAISLLATRYSNDAHRDGETYITRVSPGARFSARRDVFLAAPPRVDWSHLRFGGGEIGGRRRFTLLMIDPDAPAPRSTRRRHLPGAWGPYLHWLVTDIEADAFTPFAESETTTRRAKRKQKDETAREETRAAPRVSYVGPSPPGGGGAHRLAFVLFEQGDERSVTSVPPGLAIDAPPSARRRWDIEGFLAANAHLTPKAVSVLYCAS